MRHLALVLILAGCATAGTEVASPGLPITDLRFPTAAQALAAARPLAADVESAGTLDSDDALFADGSRYQIWRLDAAPGRRTTVRLASRRFTPFLVVASIDGDSIDVIGVARGRDGEPAIVSFEAVDAGPFLIFANGVRGRDKGEYALRAGPYEPPSMSIAGIPKSEFRALERANTAISSLGEGDRLLPDKSRFQLWRFTGRKGERLSLTMASTEFQPYVAYGRLSNDSLLIAARSNVSPHATDAQIIAELPHDGQYAVVANALSPRGQGRYTLRLEPRERLRVTLAEETLQRMAALDRGQWRHATLAANDAVLADRTHYQLWSFPGRAGEKVMVTMRSRVIDPFLYVGTVDNGALTVAALNDDHGSGTDARVRFELPATGTYVVVANAVNASELGPYAIRLERSRGGFRLR